MATLNERVRDDRLRRHALAVRDENATVRVVARIVRQFQADATWHVRRHPDLFVRGQGAEIGLPPTDRMRRLEAEVLMPLRVTLGERLREVVERIRADIEAHAAAELRAAPLALQAEVEALRAAHALPLREAREDEPVPPAGVAVPGSLGPSPIVGAAPSITATFATVPERQVAQLLASTAGGSLFDRAVERLGTGLLDQARTVLVGGLLRGQGVPTVARALSTAIGGARWGAERIVRSEYVRAGNQAALLTYERNKKHLAGVQWVATLSVGTQTRKGLRGATCPLCGSLDGRVWADPKKAKIPVLNSHPNCRCFTDGQTPVYTPRGWVPINRIGVGALVLAHTGKFRRVKKLFRERGYGGDVVRVTVKQPGRVSSGVRVTATPEHPFLRDDGAWIEAGDITPGMSLMVAAVRCRRSECDRVVPLLPSCSVPAEFCSESCRSKWITAEQWKRPEHRQSVSNKNKASMLRQYMNGRPRNTDAARRALGDRIHDTLAGPKARVLAMKGIGYGSHIERRVAWLLGEMGMPFRSQLPILSGRDARGRKRYYFVDLAIPKLKIAIECDGAYWHTDAAKDAAREAVIRAAGWTVLRLPEAMIRKNLAGCRGAIESVMKNHAGEYSTIPLEVLAVDRWRLRKPRTRFNLAVEVDESFVAKGFVTHNCTLVPILKRAADLGLPEGTRASANGQVPASLTWTEWFPQQPEAFQRALLGPARFKLFASGRAALSDFASATGVRSLAALRRKIGR